jgi:protein-tyrosine-phosphatase/DNA-binding HxlR family transcriptional regulator
MVTGYLLGGLLTEESESALLTSEISSIIIDSMNTEWSSSVRERARLHAALGEPARLAIVDRLVLGDASPTEIGRELDLPSNLLAHHLKLLEQVGVIERSRSEGDHRRTYLRLRPRTLTGLLPVGPRTAPRVVFVCTRNSARSQLAAALWARQSPVPVVSAGTHPAARVHPRAVTVARSRGLSLARSGTSRVDEVLREGDLVVAVCDNAHEELGTHAGDRLHWSVPDPARVDTADAFERAFTEIADRIDRLAPAVHLPGESHD